MNALDSYYIQLLRVGFIVLRNAIDSGDGPWISAEFEFLHNVPSLIAEDNMERHRYFWVHERETYLSWIDQKGSDCAKSRMRTYYKPVLDEMSEVIEEMLQKHDDAHPSKMASR